MFGSWQLLEGLCQMCIVSGVGGEWCVCVCGVSGVEGGEWWGGGGAGYKHDNYSLVLTHLHFVIGFHK